MNKDIDSDIKLIDNEICLIKKEVKVFKNCLKNLGYKLSLLTNDYNDVFKCDVKLKKEINNKYLKAMFYNMGYLVFIVYMFTLGPFSLVFNLGILVVSLKGYSVFFKKCDGLNIFKLVSEYNELILKMNKDYSNFKIKKSILEKEIFRINTIIIELDNLEHERRAIMESMVKSVSANYTFVNIKKKEEVPKVKCLKDY